MDKLDEQTIENYRRAIQRAAAHDPEARDASSALFAALTRGAARQREAMEIVQAVARIGVGGVITTENIATARRLIMEASK
jgi:hypothetical protein